MPLGCKEQHSGLPAVVCLAVAAGSTDLAGPPAPNLTCDALLNFRGAAGVMSALLFGHTLTLNFLLGVSCPAVHWDWFSVKCGVVVPIDWTQLEQPAVLSSGSSIRVQPHPCLPVIDKRHGQGLPHVAGGCPVIHSMHRCFSMIGAEGKAMCSDPCTRPWPFNLNRRWPSCSSPCTSSSAWAAQKERQRAGWRRPARTGAGSGRRNSRCAGLEGLRVGPCCCWSVCVGGTGS